MMKKDAKIMGIDPGLQGAFVNMDKNQNYFSVHEMPIGNDERVDLGKVIDIIDLENPDFILLERAMPLAMGAKHAFNYGRDFQTIFLACKMSFKPFELVEPNKWPKEMLQGVDANLKPKVRNEIAVERLFPKLYKKLPRGPKSGKVKDGPLDAILIAGYGFRTKKI